MSEALFPTRRDMLGRLAVAVPLAGVAATATLAAEPHPDAALLELGREMDAAWAAEDAVHDHWRGRWRKESDAAFEAAGDVTSAVVGRITGTPARTLDGLLVKARAVSWCVCGEEFTPDEGDSTDLRLAHAIVEDLRRIATGGRA